MGCVVIGRRAALTAPIPPPALWIGYSLLSPAHCDTYRALSILSPCENASQSSCCSCSFHAWVSSSVTEDECVRVCVCWWCASVRVSTGGGKRESWSTFREAPFFPPLQKSSISLNLTATNLWLHYYSQCYILIPTHRPSGGLVNGEGDGEGDRPVPLFWHSVGVALAWKSREYSLTLALLWSSVWCLDRSLTHHLTVNLHFSPGEVGNAGSGCNPVNRFLSWRWKEQTETGSGTCTFFFHYWMTWLGNFPADILKE